MNTGQQKEKTEVEGRRQEHKQTLCYAEKGPAMEILTQCSLLLLGKAELRQQGHAFSNAPCIPSLLIVFCSVGTSQAHSRCVVRTRGPKIGLVSLVFTMIHSGRQGCHLERCYCTSAIPHRFQEINTTTQPIVILHKVYLIFLFISLIKMSLFSILATVTPNGEQKTVKHYQGHKFQA